MLIKKSTAHAHHVNASVAEGQLHHEGNKNTGRFLSEIILGGQDGLVNTLGVILGIAAASSDFRIVVAGGLAGAMAEAVSMAAVGYTSKVAERDYYLSELKREEEEIENIPREEIQEIRDIYEKKGFQGNLLEEVVKVVTSDKKVWLHTMMQEELKLSPIDKGQPVKSALLIGLSSFLGALIPLLPFAVFYFLDGPLSRQVSLAVMISVGISAIALFIVGAIKSKLTVGMWYKSGVSMVLIGIISALAGYAVGLAFRIGV
jgi:predicted membrane protein (TIGR00267 family)